MHPAEVKLRVSSLEIGKRFDKLLNNMFANRVCENGLCRVAYIIKHIGNVTVIELLRTRSDGLQENEHDSDK